jgi:site-specific DNA-cytosine methylase
MQKRETEIVQFTESLLEDVKSGKMSVEEMGIKIAEKMGIKVDDNNKEYESIADAIKDINRDAPHQQDQLNCQDEAARTLAASTHGAASHLTKTVCEGIDEEGEEMCVVRRLTPTETSTLQGFPKDYTKIDGPDTSDAPQYKSHGNSWATPCANHMSTRMEMEMRRLGHKGTIKYATCCSGIEAQSVAVKNLDWQSTFFSEIEPFPCRVLEHHYPKTPNLGDMTQIHYDSEKGVITNSHAEGEEYFLPKEFKVAPIQDIPFKEGDLQVFSGGTPCQDVSVAGKRAGMTEGSGTRSSLAFHYQRIIDELRPNFTLWEQVPGAFSSNGGADFIWFVNRCAESGYSMAWRVLDAQYTMTEEFPRAVPQRRRRIWLVGYKGNDWRVPARIVFETEKALTSNPPERVPGIGFKTLSSGWEEVVHNRAEAVGESTGQEIAEGDLFGGSAEVASESKLRKVSTMIPFEDMPKESDFSQVSTAEIYTFAKLVGEPGYIGSVFRTDKKVQKKAKMEDTFDLFAMAEGIQPDEPTEEETIEEEEWIGAEKINPAVLENIGNAGIVANGRVCTLKCHEWTSGIQLSPETAAKWGEYVKNKEWEKANEVLPDAYDGTVCGLSDVLEDNPSEKYNLSWRACFGILKRAETRGKALPPALEMALVSTIREYAGIVKWVVLNGKETTKKAGDLTEKEIAKLCYDKYVAPVKRFEAVEAISPATRGGEDTESDDGSDEGEIEEDEDGNPVVSGDCFPEDEES